MGRKNKIIPELKIKAVKEYLDGESSMEKISYKYGVKPSSFKSI